VPGRFARRGHPVTGGASARSDACVIEASWPPSRGAVATVARGNRGHMTARFARRRHPMAS
jgi:hypothetical protein